MTFKERGQLSLKILGVGALVMVILGLMGPISNGGSPRKVEHKSDKQMIREAAAALEAACQLDEDKC